MWECINDKCADERVEILSVFFHRIYKRGNSYSKVLGQLLEAYFEISVFGRNIHRIASCKFSKFLRDLNQISGTKSTQLGAHFFTLYAQTSYTDRQAIVIGYYRDRRSQEIISYRWLTCLIFGYLGQVEGQCIAYFDFQQ